MSKASIATALNVAHLIGLKPGRQQREAQQSVGGRTRVAEAPKDFSHLRPAPRTSAAAPSAPCPAAFAERVLTAEAATRGETFDRKAMVAAPPQRRTVASGADIAAAYRAAHPSRFAEGK